MRWLLPTGDDADRAGRLASALSLHPIAARVLVHRGINTAEAADAFLKSDLADLPNPYLMKGMEAAVQRLARALKAKERITLYGDYDVDGVCSTALLSLFLEEVGGQVATYLPHRIAEGYGLNVPAVDRIAEDGTRVLISLDCGITSVEEVARAQARGLDVIIVDHHTVPQTLPAAVAILNPHQPGCTYPTRHLCAAGVAFNLCMGLRKRLRDEGAFAGRPEPSLRALLDLVALATIADVVPLTGANRVLVSHGLAEITRGTRPGVRALKEVAGFSAGEAIGTGQVGFRLGPRINAAGRLNDASVGLRLLRTKTMEEARPLAAQLDGANLERQAVEKEILEQALAQAAGFKEAFGLVLYARGWHPGVIGIVASRVVERFHRPTVMVGINDGVGKGSARSIEAFHLYDALAACQTHLVRFGGHKHAAGLTIAEDRLPDFREAFAKEAQARLTPEDLIPRCRVDAVVIPPELTAPAVAGLTRLAPFGSGNPEPVLVARRLVTHPRVVPRKTGEGAAHLKLSVEGSEGLSGIGFNMADRIALTEGPVDLAFHLELDTYRGESKVSLRLKDIRSAA